MDCITISSDEEEMQMEHKKEEIKPSLVTPIENDKKNVNESLNSIRKTRNSLINGSHPAIKRIPIISLDVDEKIIPTKTRTSDANQKRSPFRNIATPNSNTAVTVISLLEDGEDEIGNSKPESNSKLTNGTNLAGHKRRSTEKERKTKSNILDSHKRRRVTEKEPEEKDKKHLESSNLKLTDEIPVVVISNEPLIEKLIEICRRVEFGSEMEIVERKLWDYFNAATTEKTQSVEFKDYLECVISRIESILNSSKDKLIISRIIKDCINEMKKDPSVINRKISRLYSLYEKLNKRIIKLEEADVESDEEGGNTYVYLDRYRKKAVEVYNKICELEGRSNDADRPTLQKFYFTGSSAPIPVQRALERYYNKTHVFPDYQDIKKLVKKVNKNDQLNLTKSEVLKTAQNVFIELGERLICRRKYDDYNIVVDYLNEGEHVDPADMDTELEMKLVENRRTRKKEHEVLEEYTRLDVNLVKKEVEPTESKESTTSLMSSSTDVNKSEIISTISVSSSSESSTTSPASSDIEDFDEGTNDESDVDDENSKQKSTTEVTVIFSDSDDDYNIIDIENKRKKTS